MESAAHTIGATKLEAMPRSPDPHYFVMLHLLRLLVVTNLPQAAPTL